MVVYEKEFRDQAVKLATEQGAAKAARDLGIPYDTLYGWIKKARQYGEYAYIGSGNKRNNDGQSAEAVQYMKRIKELEKSNQILKEALGFFAASQKR